MAAQDDKDKAPDVTISQAELDDLKQRAALTADLEAQVAQARAELESAELANSSDTIKALTRQYKGSGIAVDPETGALSVEVKAPKGSAPKGSAKE